MFETDSDVREYAKKVDAQVNSLERDIMAYIITKWGPNGLSATVTADKLEDKKADYVFYHDWSDFRDSWKAMKQDIDDSYFIVLSANKYREVEKYDVDVKAWREKFAEKGIKVNAPPLTTGGTIPGVTAPTNPAAPGYEPGTVGGFNLSKIGTDLLKIGAIAGIGLIAYKVISGAVSEKS